MEPTAVPRDHLRASILLVLREADGHMATWLSRYRALRRQGGPQAYPEVSAAS